MPKLAAAIITGTMARPSRPSVRFTALPAPTMMKAREHHEEPAEIDQQLLEKREHQRGRERPVPQARTSATQATSAMHGFDQRAARARQNPSCVCFVTFR